MSTLAPMQDVHIVAGMKTMQSAVRELLRARPFARTPH
jgi:hypothetical protein